MTTRSADPVIISRDSDALVIDGLRAASLAGWSQALDQLLTGFNPVVADLSCGSWRSHQVAAEFCLQLGLPELPQAPLVIPPPVNNRPPPSHGEMVGARIDAETKGERTILQALDLATRIIGAALEQGPYAFLVVAPRFELPWEPENALFIRFLAQGLRDSAHRVLIVASAAQDPLLPDGWRVEWLNELAAAPPVENPTLLHLVPGILHEAVAAAIDPAPLADRSDMLALPGGGFLLAPERRRNPQEVSPMVFDHVLQTKADLPDWLRSFMQFYADRPFVEAAFIAAVARQRFSEGGTGIARRLLARAIDTAPDATAQATYRAQLQGMLITLQLHMELANMPEPMDGIWPQLQAILLEGKGWGLTMINSAEQAQKYLEQARQLFDQQHYQREYLYLLNILALSRLRGGNVEGALSLEQEIAATLNRQARRDHHLIYINSLNTARLYRRRKDFAESERFFEQAFETSLGLRSENDALYANATMARLYMDQGLFEKAFFCWLRAGLYWVAHSVPEAVGARVSGAVVERRVAPGDSLTEAVSAAFLKLLRETGQAANLPAVSALASFDSAKAPVFWRSDVETGAAQFASAVGGDGWSVLTSMVERPAQFSGPEYQQLRAALFSLLLSLAPAGSLDDFKTLVVDDNLGHDLPGTEAEFLATCLRLAAPKMVFGDEIVLLPDAKRAELERELQAKLGSGVAFVEFEGDRATVQFKRYRAPLVLSGDAAKLLAALVGPVSLTDLAQQLAPDQPFATTLSLARQLEQDRVVNLYL